MSTGEKISVSVVVTIVIAAVSWIFLAGGAFWKANNASEVACKAREMATGNKQEVAVIKATMDTHHAAQMQQSERAIKAVERISDKIDGFHSK